MSVMASIDRLLRGRGSEPQPQIMVMFVWGYTHTQKISRFVNLEILDSQLCQNARGFGPSGPSLLRGISGRWPHLGCHGVWLGSKRAAWDPPPRPISHGALLDACCVPVSGSVSGCPASFILPVRQDGGSRIVLWEECGMGGLGCAWRHPPHRPLHLPAPGLLAVSAPHGSHPACCDVPRQKPYLTTAARGPWDPGKCSSPSACHFCLENDSSGLMSKLQPLLPGVPQPPLPGPVATLGTYSVQRARLGPPPPIP